MLDNLKRKNQMYSLDSYSNDTAKIFLCETCVILDQNCLYTGNIRCSRSEALTQSTFPKLSGRVEMFLKTAKKTIPIEMRVCRPGVFEMGHIDSGPKTEYQIGNLPHPEVIKRPFFLGTTEVSVELFLAVMEGKNIDSNHTQRRARLEAIKDPELKAVELVGRRLMLEFCNELSLLSGLEPCYIKKHRPTIILFKDTSVVSVKDEKKRSAFYEELRDAIKTNCGALDLLDYDPQMTLADLHAAEVWVGHGAGSRIMKSFDDKPYYKYRIKKVDINLYHSFLQGGKPRDPYKVYSDIKKHFRYDLHLNSYAGIIFDPTKNGYRLPTRIEWEYAAKAGTNSKWSGTNKEEEVLDYARVAYDYNARHEPLMKTKKPNAWGFYDMTGNVWEDTWNVSPFDPNEKSLCGGGPVGENTNGKWTTLGVSDMQYEEDYNHHIGFRLARNV